MTLCPALLRGGRGALGLVLAGLLAACTVPEWQKPGTPATQVQTDMGTPQIRVALPGGGERWVYSRQPAGQQVYHMDFDAERRLVQVRNVLTEGDFNQLKPDVDRRDDVMRYFGKPALVEGVASFRGDIWTYRLLEHNIPRMAHVFIDPQGMVRRVMFTDELRNDDDRGR